MLSGSLHISRTVYRYDREVGMSHSIPTLRGRCFCGPLAFLALVIFSVDTSVTVNSALTPLRFCLVVCLLLNDQSGLALWLDHLMEPIGSSVTKLSINTNMKFKISIYFQLAKTPKTFYLFLPCLLETMMRTK